MEKEQQNGILLSEDVVMRLIINVDRNGGYNSKIDKFFASVHLAGLLSQQNMTIVTAIHANSKDYQKI